MRNSSLLVSIAVATLVVLTGTVPAGAHAERPANFPDGSGHVPKYRPMVAENHLVVCKSSSSKAIAKIDDAELRAINEDLLDECGFAHVQDAVDAVAERGSTIYILPGVYKEDPYRTQPKCAEDLPQPEDGASGAPILTYKEQLFCPQAQNLIGVFGDIKPDDDERECNAPVCDLQIEGTGDDPGDVLITGGFDKDGKFAKLNGIRGDRSDGLYMKNFTIELFEFNAIYVLETDGFVIDDVVSRYNDEYGFLTFAVDHGVYKDCDGYNNGDSLIYPGSASDVNADSDDYTQTKRWSIEIFNCTSHHNALGYSGTAGNSVYVHDNKFFANQAGIATDSLYPDHPGLPQDHGWFTRNEIYSNNSNYTEKFVQSGICDKPPAERGYKPPKNKKPWEGTVCPVVPAPVGTGMVIAGGNWNLLEANHVWDNWRTGFMLISAPAPLRNETDPNKTFDTSHHNMYIDNIMGIGPDGKSDLNGTDFWWDDTGEGNCWQNNVGDKELGVRSNTLYPGGLPDCEVSGGSIGLPANPYKQGQILTCALYNPRDDFWRDPPACDFYDTPSEP